MTNLLDYKRINKTECQKVLNSLKNIAKKNPNLAGFSSRLEKNNRGDYGYNDLYVYEDNIFLIVSFDGGRIDIHYYVSPHLDIIMDCMKTNSKKHLHL